MKAKKKTAKICVTAVCIAALAAGIVFAVKYNKPAIKPAVTTTEKESVTATESTTKETATEPATENPTEKDTEEAAKEKTILNCPESEKDYEPTAFEAKLFNAVNKKREENSLKPLEWNTCLHTRAKIRSDEAVLLFSHTRPDGKKPSSVLTDEGISFTVFGECLAKGTKENDEGVNLLIEGFMKEQAQSEMILSNDFSYSAVAVSTDENGNVCAAVLFCKP